MKRLVLLCVAVVLGAAPGFAQTTTAAKAEKMSPAAGKTMTAMGKVTAVAADSLTVKGKDGEWTFTVDKSTDVKATGASHKSDKMKAEKMPTVITEFVKVGDEVSVKYHDMGATKHAASVMVRNAMAAPMKMKKH